MNNIKIFLKCFNIFSYLFYSKKEINKIINRTDAETFYEDTKKLKSDWEIILGKF